MWRIGRERTLLVGGQAALLLQIAHPLIAEAVARHSGFRLDPFERLRATLDATLRIAFGDTEQAHEAAERVRRTHRRVRGQLDVAAGPFPEGTPYAAEDPELAMWVHATLVWSALEVYGRFVHPLAEAERARYYEEAKRFAALFGATGAVVPASFADFERYFARATEGLWVGERAVALAGSILEPPVPKPLRAVARVVRIGTTGLLPERIRRAYGLSWDGRERRAFRIESLLAPFAVGANPRRLRYWPHYRIAARRAAISA